MKPPDKYLTTAFIVTLELLLGVLLGMFFIKLAWDNDSDELWGKTIADGIIRMYGTLSLIFFFSVFLVGIIGAVKLKRANKIGKAISFSLLFWILSLFVSVILTPFGGIASLFVVLIGIVVGFNLGLAPNSEKGAKDPGV